MRKWFFVALLCATVILPTCTPEDTDLGTGIYCERDSDCGDTTIYFCNKVTSECQKKSGAVDPDDTEGYDGDPGDDTGGTTTEGDPTGDEDIVPAQDIDYAGLDCAPGSTEKCAYTGPSGTEDVGACKAPVRLCKSDGTWGNCNGQVLPTLEICGNGIDEDCNGLADDGDIDGDGWGMCDDPPDCCETKDQCPDPKSVNPGAAEVPNGIDDDCDGVADNGVYDCDTGLDLNTKNPFDYAKSIGLCNGVTEANITQTDGGSSPNINSNALLAALGNVIKPKHGGSMLALSSGQAQNPPSNTSFNQGTSSQPTASSPGNNSPGISDWYGANGNKYPSSPSCGGGTGTTGAANDNVMVTLRIQVPPTANSFSFNIYFLTIEYPNYICTQYNDFFVALLDSGYNANPTDPTLLNPTDKNLATDDLGNPVGVNLAPNGLFKQCVNVPSKGVTSCIGTEELAGTGFESSGGTGWLVTRGNVIPGEIITLRFAIWDLGDHILDSMVLIDNFQWQSTNFKPGTGDS